MFFKEIRSVTKRAILLFLLVCSIILFINAHIQNPNIQKKILKRVSDAIGYDVEANNIEINLWNGLSLSINDLKASSRQGNEKFTASNVILKLEGKELLAGRIIPSSIYLTNPVIELPWEDVFTPDAELKGFLPEKIPVFWFPGIHSMVINRGRVVFIGASFYLDDFYLNASRISTSPLTLMVTSKGQIGHNGKKARFELNGKVMPPSTGNAFSFIDVKLKTGKAPLTWFQWPASTPVKDGYFNTKLEIKGNPAGPLSMKGTVDLTRLEFEIVKKDRYKRYIIPDVTLDLKSTIGRDNIVASPVKIKIGDLSGDLGLIFNLKKENNPFLDLNFKSEFMKAETFKTLFPSSLLPQWLEERLFPILSGGDVRVDNFSLKGDVDQIRNMSRPENQSVMEMLFECRGFEGAGNGINLPFKDMSADIALKDGLFSVSGFKANFGDSFITDASLNIRDIYNDSRVYEILMDGDFDIKELLSQKEMDLVPIKASLWLDKLPDITGRIKGKTAIGYQNQWDCPRILNGEFLLKRVSLNKKEFIFPIKLNEASIHIDDSGSDSISGSGSWGKNSFNISAEFGITCVTPNFKEGHLSADVDMNQLLSVLHLKDKIPLIFSETLPWEVSLSNDGAEWSLKGNVLIGKTEMRSGRFTIKSTGTYKDNIDFKLGINPDEKRIDIKNALLRLKDSSIGMTGTYDLQAGKLVKVDLNSSGLSMKDISISSDENEIFYGGTIKGDLSITMPDTEGHGILLTGLMEGADISFQPGQTSPQISDCSFQLGFSGKGAKLNHSNMKAGKNTFSIEGDIKKWSDLEADIKIHSDYLDFTDIFQINNSLSTVKESDKSDSLINHLKLGIQLDASGGVWRKMPFKQMNADLALENGDLFIKDSKVNLDDGDLTIKGHILNGQNPEMLFASDFNIKGQPVNALLEELEVGYKGLRGDIDLNGSLSVKGKNKDELISSLNGSVSVLMTKGLIKNPNVIIKVLDFLSLQKIFKQRPSDLKEEGLYFESISGDAVFEKGVLKTENFVMRSPILNAVAYGKADIPGRKVDFVLGAQPHGTIDSLVSKLPIIGYIFAGKNKSIIAYPFEVKGTFSDPDVKFVPFDTLEGGVVGILKRIFLTPLRIFNKIDKVLDKNKEETAP